MAYIPYTPIVPERSSAKSVIIPITENGTVLSDENDCGACTVNLDFADNTAMTRKAFIRKTAPIAESGVFHSITKDTFCDRIVIHVGTSLYTYSENDTFATRLECTLPDKKSIFVYFMSCLYIYCDYRIFKLNDRFELTECEPYVPTLFENLGTTASNAVQLDVPHNMLSPVIRAKYKTVHSGTFYFPYPADITRPVRVYESGGELEQSKLTITEEKVQFTISQSIDYKATVEIVYYLKNPADMGFDDTIYRCGCVESFGGAVGGGTRIFFTGDSERKGYYYRSGLQDPLYVPSDEYEIVGDGCENVTSLIKMYGNLVMLTERGVYQMGYSLGESGAMFSIKQLTNAVGCDMPNSVQLVDNRVVFANSKKGLYIIDCTEDNGEHNIKPLSYNIMRGKGLGFLDNDRELLKSATSCDFDRRYFLFVGSRAYIWDYDESPYSDTGSYSKAQRRLDFYIYDGMTAGLARNLGESFVIFSPTELSFYGFDDTSDGVNFMYKSGGQSFGRDDLQKYVTRLTLVLSSNVHKRIQLSALEAGESYYTRKIDVCEKKKCITVYLPKKPLFEFSYKLWGNGNFKLYSARAEYVYLTK